MIIGTPTLLAIESEIDKAFDNRGLLALGFFVVYVQGRCYGVRESEATFLACSFDEVERRIANRGKHVARFAESDARQLADAYIAAIYGEAHPGQRLGIPHDEFCEMVHESGMVWAPDGDTAFDDRSHILQFDVGAEVRVIAFNRGVDPLYDSSSLVDIRLPADVFYGVLDDWRIAFSADWEQREDRIQ